MQPEYVLSHNHDRVVLRNYEGRVFEYPESAGGAPMVVGEDAGRPTLGFVEPPSPSAASQLSRYFPKFG